MALGFTLLRTHGLTTFYDVYVSAKHLAGSPGLVQDTPNWVWESILYVQGSPSTSKRPDVSNEQIKT